MSDIESRLYVKLEEELKTASDAVFVLGINFTATEVPKRCVTDVENVCTVLDGIKRQITSSNRNAELLKRLNPFGLAYLSLCFTFSPETMQAAVQSVPEHSHSVAAFNTCCLAENYVKIFSDAYTNVTADQVPVDNFLDTMKPMALVDNAVNILQRAFDEIQTAQHPPDSKRMVGELRYFQASLFCMFDIIRYLAYIILQNPLVAENGRRIKSNGCKYVSEKALRKLHAKCTHFVVSTYNKNGVKIPEGATCPCIKVVNSVGELLKFGSARGATDDLHEFKKSIYYSRDYDECYLRAFEALAVAVDVNASRADVERSSIFVSGVFNGLRMLVMIGNEVENETTTPGLNDALKYSGSGEVHERLYKVLSQMFDSAVEFEDKSAIVEGDDEKSLFLNQAAVIYALVANATAVWGLKRLVSVANRNPYSLLSNGEPNPLGDVNPQIVILSDILMSSSWIKLLKIFETHGEPYVGKYGGELTPFFSVYTVRTLQMKYPFHLLLDDGAYSYPDEDGQYSSLGLIMAELNTLYDMLMMLPVQARFLPNALTVYCNSAHCLAIQTINLSLTKTDMAGEGREIEYYESLWSSYRFVALSMMKAAKSWVTEMGSSRRFAEQMTEVERLTSAVNAVGKCFLFLYYIPELKKRFEDAPSEESLFEEVVAALAFLGLDVLANVPFNVWDDKQRLQSYLHIGSLVSMSRDVLVRALPPSDRGLAMLQKIFTEILKGLEDPSLKQAFGSEYAAHLAKATENNKEINSMIEEIETAAATASTSTTAEGREIARAVERAEILECLPCASVSCRAVSYQCEAIPAKWCSACRVTRYCSPQCQKKDWKTHKIACKALAAKNALE